MAVKEYIERGKINDYISKLREYVSASVGLSQAEYSFISDILTALENFPAADVVPVVHCKNCEYNNECSVQDFGEMHQNDFCSRGKRRSDNG